MQAVEADELLTGQFLNKVVYIVITVHGKVNTHINVIQWNAVLEMPILGYLFKKCLPYYETRSFTSVFVTTQNWILSQVHRIRSTPSQPTYLNHKLSQVASAPSDCSLKFNRHSSCNHACYKPHPTHLPPCVRFSIIGRRIEVTKLLVLTGLFALIFLLFSYVQTLSFTSL